MQFIKARNLDVRKRISLQKFFEKNEHRANDRDSPFRSLLLGLRNSSGSPFHSKTTHMGFIGQCTLHVIPAEVEESLTTSEGRRNNKEYRTRTYVPHAQSARLLARAAARSPLKTIHWIVFRAFRTRGDRLFRMRKPPTKFPPLGSEGSVSPVESTKGKRPE